MASLPSCNSCIQFIVETVMGLREGRNGTGVSGMLYQRGSRVPHSWTGSFAQETTQVRRSSSAQEEYGNALLSPIRAMHRVKTFLSHRCRNLSKQARQRTALALVVGCAIWLLHRSNASDPRLDASVSPPPKVCPQHKLLCPMHCALELLSASGHLEIDSRAGSLFLKVHVKPAI